MDDIPEMRQRMIMGVSGIEDADFAHEFLQVNSCQLEASVNAYKKMLVGRQAPDPTPAVQRLTDDMSSGKGREHESLRNFAVEGMSFPQSAAAPARKDDCMFPPSTHIVWRAGTCSASWCAPV